jgi:DNA sulfur modification protein DndB
LGRKKALKNGVQAKKLKSHSIQLEDKVWELFYKLDFSFLSGNGGGRLIINPKDDKSPRTQIDVVAIDSDIAIAIECKSSASLKKRPQFQEELGKFVNGRESFIKAIKNKFSSEVKKQIIFGMFLDNVILSDADRERARLANVILFDKNDLAYYEHLVMHLGPRS